MDAFVHGSRFATFTPLELYAELLNKLSTNFHTYLILTITVACSYRENHQYVILFFLDCDRKELQLANADQLAALPHYFSI